MASRGEPSVERTEAAIGVRRAEACLTRYACTRVKVDFIPIGSLRKPKKFGHVPLRFVHASELDLDGWRTLHLCSSTRQEPLKWYTARRV